MQATSTLTGPISACNTNGFLTIGEASTRYNVHPNSLRRWVDSGKLPAMVTPGNHRKIRASALESLLGLTNGEAVENNNGGLKIALLARVSSYKQGKNFDCSNGQTKEGGEESDLARQVDVLRKYAKEKYGKEGELYNDIGSGLNYDRRSFVRLLEEICQGKWSGGVVIATFKDRVCRYGFELVELICRTHNVKLEIVNAKTDCSDEQDLAADVLSIITHFSAKQHGQRAGIKGTFNLSPEAIDVAKQLHDSGYPVMHIVKILKQQGFTMVNGRNQVRPITKWVLARMFDGNGVQTLLEVALPKVGDEKTSFEQFAELCLVKTGNEKDTLRVSEIYRLYNAYCQQEEVLPCSRVVIGKWLKLNAVRRYQAQGKGKVSGLTLKA